MGRMWLKYQVITPDYNETLSFTDHQQNKSLQHTNVNQYMKHIPSTQGAGNPCKQRLENTFHLESEKEQKQQGSFDSVQGSSRYYP